MLALINGPDGQSRCAWCANVAEFIPYHDQEWGFPVADDQRLFEKICLESFQAGLSWRTILAKRAALRAQFAQFDYQQVAKFGEPDVQRLLANPEIIRHQGKIRAVIGNAQRAIELTDEFGSLAQFFWQFEPTAPPMPSGYATQCHESQAMAKALKQRGWRFVGPTICYAFMQAMGMVNDHQEGCVMRAEVSQARKHFRRPSS